MPRPSLTRFGQVLKNASLDSYRNRFRRLARTMASAFEYPVGPPGDPRVLQLLRLRVAQLSPCSSCLTLHTDVATKIGISLDVVAHLPSWRESTLFSTKEQAALGFCEALTVFDEERFAAAHRELRTHFPEHHVAEIINVVVYTNLWIRLNVEQGSVPGDTGAR